jgi:hypothetical protein
MEAYIFVRHASDCPHQDEQFFRRCKCRKWIYVTGTRQRISAKTRSWEQAERELQKVRERLKESDPQSDDNPVEPDPQTVREAVTSFLENKQQEGMSKNWERRLTRDLTNFAKWCESRLIPLAKVRKRTLEDFRKTWEGAAITRSKQQERLKLFCKYCAGHGWMKQNYAADLSRIKVEDKPTLPLTREQFDAALAAAARYNPKSNDSEHRRQRAWECSCCYATRGCASAMPPCWNGRN